MRFRLRVLFFLSTSNTLTTHASDRRSLIWLKTDYQYSFWLYCSLAVVPSVYRCRASSISYINVKINVNVVVVAIVRVRCVCASDWVTDWLIESVSVRSVAFGFCRHLTCSHFIRSTHIYTPNRSACNLRWWCLLFVCFWIIFWLNSNINFINTNTWNTSMWWLHVHWPHTTYICDEVCLYFSESMYFGEQNTPFI